ncbi:uncharacterized protein TNCV_716621 [Trichonephila clavipes]|nr:uncharacterized protein TNCV_716621 [Trichonephila clavipes]
MDEACTTQKVFNAQAIGTWKKGRSDLRWIDGLEKYPIVLRTKNWRTLAERRLAWKTLLEKAKAHLRLRATEEDRKEAPSLASLLICPIVTVTLTPDVVWVKGMFVVTSLRDGEEVTSERDV